MVCKKYQVYDWFRTLDGAKRIDFLNGMLHLCFPLELRFLGSCIEELARKDYTYLRDAEIKANAAFEIQLMRDITDKVTRSKMIVTLALLASSNHECARLIYDLLNVDILDMLEKMKLSLDEKIADEFLLLLTMAANHPAFDFQMKTKMSQLYLNAELKLKQNKIILKESESDLCLYNSNNTQDDSALTLQPKTSSSKLNEDTKVKEENQSDKPESEISKEPLIESIDFEGVQMIKGTDNYKFLIKIRWSDKSFNVIDKTYSELCEFNKQLNNLYPTEMSGIETSQLVFKENQKEDVVKELPLVTDYCSKIASLPKLVCESEFLRSFFRSNLSNSSITIANDSNSPNRLINTTTINTSRSPPPLLNIAQQSIAKNVDENANKIPNKSESPNHLEEKIENLKLSESVPKSDKTTNEAKKLANQQATKAKIDRTVVSVSQALSAHASNQRSEQTLPPAQHHQYNTRTNNTSNNQMINYSQQPLPAFHHPNSLFQQHYINMNQPLHLQTFQSNQNMIISSPPCQSPSAISSSAPTASQLATNPAVINPQSSNNSRSNSPWNSMPPPPLPSLNQQQQQAMINNNAQFYPPYFLNYNQHTNNSHHFRSNSNNSNKSSSNFKDSKHQNYNMHHPMMSSHEDLLLRCALDNHAHLNNMPPQMMPPSAPYDENANYYNENISNKQPHHNNRSNKSSSDLKKNSSKSKIASQHQSTNDSLLTTTNNQQNCNETTNTNGSMSPKLINNNSNQRPSSSNLNSTQSFPISVTTLPLHLQQHHKQQMLSPQNNQVVMGSYNYPQPNPNLISIPQQTPANQQGNNTFLLTPLIPQTSIVYEPSSLPPPTHSAPLQQQQQSNSKYQSKQNRQNAERPRSPTSSNLTSDEENNDKKTNNRRSSSINSGQRVHRKMSSSSSSSTNNNGTNQNNKYSFSRQHNSHSISSTTTTIKPSSVSNASSNSSLNSNNNRVSGSSNSLSASPSNQQPNTTIVSPANSKNNTSNKISKVIANNDPILSPKSLNLKQMKQQNQIVSPVDGNKEDKNSEDNKIKNEQNDTKERNNINGQYSSSSSSSSISTVTLMNNNNAQSKSPHVSNLISIPPPAQSSQSSSLSSSSTITNNNMFYSPVVPPFTYIDGGNIYALTNGLNPNLPPSVNHSMVPSAINTFNPYQQSSLPPHHHHQSNSNNYLMQPQHQPYYNLIPMMQSNPSMNLVQQPSGQQPYQLQNQAQPQPNSNNNNNFATPTPGSSPNPISSSSSSSSSNLNGIQHQQQPPPPPYSIDQQLLNPYNFNMMALANAVANSSNGQPINPNMVMMMMMHSQQPPLPPILPNQLQQTQMMNNNNNNKYNYQHYQPYRSQTPNSLQQPSPSSNLINSTTSSRSNQQQNMNKKKISCYNCGLMNHTAKDCDQPTLETISQPTQYRLSFKSNNQNGPTTSSSHLNTQSQAENSDETLATKNLNSPNDFECIKNGISVTTNGAVNSTSSASASSSASTSSLASSSLKKTVTNIVSPDSTSAVNFK